MSGWEKLQITLSEKKSGNFPSEFRWSQLLEFLELEKIWYLGISTPRDTLISGEFFAFPVTLGVPNQGGGYTK